MSQESSILPRLLAVIAERKANPPARSYVSGLLQGGVAKIGPKITEEAAEVVEAASEPGEEGRNHLIHEVADLFFHTFVLLESREISWNQIEDELGRRFGISGLDEKESRKAGS